MVNEGRHVVPAEVRVLDGEIKGRVEAILRDLPPQERNALRARYRRRAPLLLAAGAGVTGLAVLVAMLPGSGDMQGAVESLLFPGLLGLVFGVLAATNPDFFVRARVRRAVLRGDGQLAGRYGAAMNRYEWKTARVGAVIIVLVVVLMLAVATFLS